MAINEQVLEGGWKQVKGKIHQRWGQISDDELEESRGNVEQLVGLILQKTGETRQQVEEYLEQVAANGGSGVARVTEAVRSSAEQAAGAAQQAMERVSDSARVGYIETERMVRERPWESLAVCFGTGLITGVVVGLMMRSK